MTILAAAEGRRRKKEAVPAAPILPAIALPFKAGLSYFAEQFTGGLETMLELCAASADESLRAFAAAVRRKPQHQVRLLATKGGELEAVCREIGIEPRALVGMVTEEAFAHSHDLTRLVLAIEQPNAVKAAAVYAMLPDGHKDRRMLLQATGAVPVPASHVTATAIAGARASAGGEDDDLPSFAVSVKSTSDAVRAARAINVTPRN